MQDYSKWGIMTDWRYSYLTMSKLLLFIYHYIVPTYESTVIGNFSKLVKNN